MGKTIFIITHLTLVDFDIKQQNELWYLTTKFNINEYCQ